MLPSKPRNVRDGGRIWWLLLIWIVAVCIMTACSTTPRTKYEWLSVFLDGVPDPNAPIQESVPASFGQMGEPSMAATVVAEMEPGRFFHAPYQERDCQACHASAYSNKLILPAQELCFSCHFEWIGRVAFDHAPTLSGDCLECHLPHSSEFEHLLIDNGPQLCHQCHQEKLLSPIDAHIPGETAACYTCHNPHESTQKFLLYPEVAEGLTP